MILSEIRKPAFKEPVLPAAKDEDIQAVREAVGFLFAVQKRLEKLDERYADTDDYGGIGIYHHYIGFRWFGGGGESIPTADKQAIRTIVKEERSKRRQLCRFLGAKVLFEDGEGSIAIDWLHDQGFGRNPAWDNAWHAAGMKHVDYSDMVKDLHALGDER
jgi:hypothetical protein